MYSEQDTASFVHSTNATSPIRSSQPGSPRPYKENVVCAHSGLLSSHSKERGPAASLTRTELEVTMINEISQTPREVTATRTHSDIEY